MVARDFHLQSYIDMVDTPAFHVEVSAYPSITVIEKAPPVQRWLRLHQWSREAICVTWRRC